MVSKGRLSPADAEIADLEVSYSFPSGRDRARIVCLLRAKPPAVAILKEAVVTLEEAESAYDLAASMGQRVQAL